MSKLSAIVFLSCFLSFIRCMNRKGTTKFHIQTKTNHIRLPGVGCLLSLRLACASRSTGGRHELNCVDLSGLAQSLYIVYMYIDSNESSKVISGKRFTAKVDLKSEGQGGRTTWGTRGSERGRDTHREGERERRR